MIFFGEKVLSVYIKEPLGPAQACIIWMHGLGADASDMAGLVDQLPLHKDCAIRHLFVDAPLRPVTLNGGMVMRAWYDLTGLELYDRMDQQGIEQSELLIRQIIETQLTEGFSSSQIFLAGFSQGGAMALHIALHSNMELGGVIALSAYLPLQGTTKALLDKNTPFFIALGQLDPLVLPKWTMLSKEWLIANGYDHISFYQYPMEHSICADEIKDISLWLTQQIQGEVK